MNENYEYSFLKGLSKAALYTLSTAATLVAFTGMANVEIWSLLEEYLKPALGSITVGGAITMAINYVRFKRK